MDRMSPANRSKLMSRIRGRDTKPELIVRRLAHALGYRFRLHRRDLPGTPDLVFPGRRTVVFVHGCFWHGHECRAGKGVKSNVDFWSAKLRANAARDRRNEQALLELGWRVLTVWECETRDTPALSERLQSFLNDSPLK